MTDSQPVLSPFRHEAFFYANAGDYLNVTVPFIRLGLDAGEAILVIVPSAKVGLLQSEFREREDHGLRFATTEDFGRNPARLLAVWADFIAASTQRGLTMRGIGETSWPGRSHDELLECARHEALVNVAFGDLTGLSVLCPYDATLLHESVITEAHRSHPHIAGEVSETTDDRFQSAVEPLLSSSLAPIPPFAQHRAFGPEELRSVRMWVKDYARSRGASQNKTDDLSVAVGEAISNSIHHGGGSGQVSIWHEETILHCEIRDRGIITNPLAGRVRPPSDQTGGRGLWLMNQLCDLVQIRSTSEGQTIRLNMQFE